MSERNNDDGLVRVGLLLAINESLFGGVSDQR